MASTKDDQPGNDGDAQEQKRELPESIQKLRAYTGRANVPPPQQQQQQKIESQEEEQQSLNRMNRVQPLKGPYAKQPPVYVGKLNRKDLARKNRIQTALLGLGLGTMVMSIYGYTLWKRMQLGIDDKELIRLEEEALRMVEEGEIDLDALEAQHAEAKHHEY